MPGESIRLGLGNTPRSRSVPVIMSRRLSAKSIMPFVRIAVLIRQPQKDLELGLAGRAQLPLPLQNHAPQFQQRPLVDVEIGVDRVQRDDRGQRGLIGLDHVARIDQLPAHPAVARGVDLGPREVELGQVAARPAPSSPPPPPPCGRRRSGRSLPGRSSGSASSSSARVRSLVKRSRWAWACTSAASALSLSAS